jgi:D-alanine-D-alanine ligase
MLIGLTYDLRAEYLAAGYSEEETAEFDRAETIDAIESALRELGHEADRIGNARQLIERLAAGARWELVFNICEGLHGIGREAQVPAILDVYDIAYTFSDPLVMALSLHKGLTKTVLREAGVPTPRFMVVEGSGARSQASGGRSQESGVRGQGDDAISPDPCPLNFPLFIKPVAEGTGKGVDPSSIVHDLAALRGGCWRLIEKFKQPVLVEEYLPGREFTVGLIGTGPRAAVLGTMEIVLRGTAEPNVYSYANKELSEERVDYPLVSAKTDATVREAETIALQAWRALGGRDAGRIDLRCDAAGRPQFIEVNPLAGLHPAHSDLPMLCTALGVPYVELIRRIVESAAGRLQAADFRLRPKAKPEVDLKSDI